MERGQLGVHTREAGCVAMPTAADFVTFAIMGCLVCCEFFVSGITRGFTPRLDILYMLFMHSKRKTPGYFALFCVGLLRDFMFFSPMGSSSTLLALSAAILDRYRFTSFFAILRCLVLIYGIQWIVNSLMSWQILPIILPLIQQMPFCIIAGILLRPGRNRRRVTFGGDPFVR